ncbi:LEAF RUST 10 DISEASE-RESISTANCE LOCUS RECEPTOR-LIKE PROTEIN KINASE-like 1.5 [Phalaenopsis equestris]|uniref:LEAF RUST 10 DISEASE-RESISTANCE LOCUS RECEPTOR-LIKE PROTEIN KINASE-like 1.5 n=1 Tax=Phalaenopsis equestris TaxID=78828 RepID=UPI0009E27672|nr:LEAF RUST 10 DISEASE-RESISTANCE LOCUS RECEPTOR-LIKE PROTEIN KINASE-like 1.5 [Phalaenopsis equestris]
MPIPPLLPHIPSHGAAAALLLLRLLLILLLLPPAISKPPPSNHPCSPNPAAGHPCPPFPSPPSSFPFSSHPGCGHPSFQIHCSSSSSLISIHSTSFRVLSIHPNNTILLSPFLPIPSSPTCPPIPSSPLLLSPFRPSLQSCNSLSFLLPCHQNPSSSSSSSSCSLSPFHLRLAADPLSLFPTCPRSPAVPSRRCTPDILSAISTFLENGVLLEWNPRTDPYFAKCSDCRDSVTGLCGFNNSSPSKPFLCFPSPSHLPHHHPRLLTLIFLAVAVAILISTCLLIAGVRRRSHNTSVSDLLDRHHIQQPPIYTYEQLRSWTNGFDSRRKIGDGGFGAVYLAQLDDGRIAAVKRLHRRPDQPTLAAAACTRSFCNEIKILSSLRHPNLVRLHGYCCDPRGLVLVYDYVPNGTLADHLHGTRSLYRKIALTWPVRLDIAIQTAAALEYLHFALKPPVVHRDITSSNIFIERDMRIKVGDFGLSRLLAGGTAAAGGRGGAMGREEGEDGCCTGPQGTPGYLDPEYHRTFRLTEKSDVYSLGVVMMELVTGMKAVDSRRDKREVSLAEMVVGRIQVGELRRVVDPAMISPPGEDAQMRSIESVAELAFRCVAGEKDDRPDAREIVEQLSRIRSRFQEQQPPPQQPRVS